MKTKDKTVFREPNHSIYRHTKRETFTVADTRLVVEDRINLFFPWLSERVLWIEGTDAYYSVVPLSSACHRLLCFHYCEEALKICEPDFYRHALILGCGGGAVPRWLLEEYPSLTVDVVDRSTQIITVCRKYFLNEWEGSARLRYYCTDARDYDPPKYQYQFIFCDLFDGSELAPLVYTEEFAEKLRGMICEEGILVINCGWNHLDEIKRIYQPMFKCLQVIKREPWQTEVIKARGGF